MPGARDLPDRTMMFTAVDEQGLAVSTVCKVTTFFQVDQMYNPSGSPGSWHNILSYTPVGQEFVPSLNALDIVQLRVGSAYSPNHPTAEFIVNIRSGTITGPIAGTSDTLALAVPFDDIATFVFDRIWLTAGETYVIELKQLSGWNWLIGHDSVSPFYYSGRLILDGNPWNNNDAWFRTGMGAPLPDIIVPAELR